MTADPDLQDILGNFSAYQELLELLRKREAIAFVGAGASWDLYRGWTDLIEFLITKAKELGLTTDKDQNFWLRHASRRPQQVVRAIKHAFRDMRVYENVLREYFEPRIHPQTGKAYTPIHQAIVELSFRGIVTTNYDAGLFEALRSCRPDLPALRCDTWKDTTSVNCWYSRDVFKNKNDMCPLLYAHGSWNRPETIILDNDMYREAYSDGPFRRMFQHLWATERLVIIGIGFSDSWLDRILDDILTHMVHSLGTRHVAIMGLREEDKRHVIQLRGLMQNAYNASVYFYPVKQKRVDGRPVDDHSELPSFLRNLRISLSKPDEFGPVELTQEAQRTKVFAFRSRDYE
ncbi:MAG: SIR2 family protein [Chloroflexi bacterium]|nr:SIR2 family protein [Chloroflexota bacterium]